jgi:hypothetical protein
LGKWLFNGMNPSEIQSRLKVLKEIVVIKLLLLSFNVKETMQFKN